MPLVFHWAKAPQSCDQSTLRPTVIDRDVLALEIAGISQTLPEPGHKVCRGAGRPSAEEPDHRHCRLLRAPRAAKLPPPRREA